MSRALQGDGGTDREGGRQLRKLAVVFAALGLAAVLALGGVAAAFSGSTGAAGLSPASGIPAELVPLIERAGGAYCDLPPPLLAAVLKVESGFDNTAVNPRSGAFTMAQFLPGTWEEWKVNGNPDENATIDPGDVADVIFSAAHYLCGLGAGTPDTQRLAVAAYNAGPTRVREWWGARKSDDLEVWVEQIPYNETRNFVRRVMVGWEEYRRLYADAGSPATVTR